MRKVIDGESGQTVTEYALVIALVALVVAVSLAAVTTPVMDFVAAVAEQLSALI
jgi:Flp pilus assembly pilin Flp